MTQKFSIKDIRRIETEVDEEIRYVTLQLNDVRQEHQQTRATAFTVGETSLRESFAKFNELVGIRFEIRSVVADFNEENNINERTSRIAELEQQKAFVDDRLATFGRPGTTRDYNTDTVVYTPGISTEVVDEFRSLGRDLKRQIQRLKDSCNGINSNARFEISEKMLAVFTKYGFIDKQ